MVGFREAIEARDMDAVDALLADDVVFRSPVAFKPYPGKAITSAILRAVVKVEGLDVTGCDFLRYDTDGKIVDFMVMVRPLRAAEALARQMGARFGHIQANAAAGLERA
jgi:hypothetical protein